MGQRQEERLSPAWIPAQWRSWWLATLLAAAFLLLPPATGLSATWQPANPIEGGSVTLMPSQILDPFISCTWFRGETTDQSKRIFIYYSTISKLHRGPAYTKREMKVQICSLRISDLRLNDSGSYTVTLNSARSAKASVKITVSVSILLPPATWEPANPIEGGSVTLRPQGISNSFHSCAWFRGEKPDQNMQIFVYYPATSELNSGLAYTKREKRVHTCSLRISDLRLNDSGIYTVMEDSSRPAKASVNITVSAPAPSHPAPLQLGAIAGVVLGSLAGIALIGGLLYLFLRGRIWNYKTPTQTAAAPLAYENVSTSEQVWAENFSDPHHIYESLQHGDRAVYDQLKW